jgi:hypothetical protein
MQPRPIRPGQGRTAAETEGTGDMLLLILAASAALMVVWGLATLIGWPLTALALIVIGLAIAAAATRRKPETRKHIDTHA